MRFSNRFPGCLHALQLHRRVVGALGTILLIGAGVSCRSVTVIRHEGVTFEGFQQVLESPVKVHLVDGSTVLFPDGAVVDEEGITGDGELYDIRLIPTGSVSRVARADVTSMERFRTDIDAGRTMRYSVSSSLIWIGLWVGAALAAR